MRVKLDSPYGFLVLPNGKRIENGTEGEITENRTLPFMVLFEGETEPAAVPVHWLDEFPDNNDKAEQVIWLLKDILTENPNKDSVIISTHRIDEMINILKES